MKIQIASDLHLEFDQSRLPPVTAFRPAAGRDVLVLAGDIGRGLLARQFVLRELPRSPVIYVPGNHEYYGLQRRATIDADRHAGLHYLVAEGLEIDGVRFWGAPWYTDLWGAYNRQAVWEVEEVRQSVNDFQYPYDGCGDWSVRAHVEAHTAQTELLRAQASQVDVVVTHWPPTLQAMHPRFRGDALNPPIQVQAERRQRHRLDPHSAPVAIAPLPGQHATGRASMPEEHTGWGPAAATGPEGGHRWGGSTPAGWMGLKKGPNTRCQGSR